MAVVDGEGMILGRIGSKIAKKLMQGEEVHLINAEKMVIVGNPKNIVENYLLRRRLQHKGTPEKSPKWPKVPFMLVKRIIRGMLPYKKAKGRMAIKKLVVYNGNPKGLVADTKFDYGKSKAKMFITVAELSKQLGYQD